MARSFPDIYIYLFVFFRDLFKEFAPVKLFVLAISLTSPVFLLNFLITFFLLSNIDKYITIKMEDDYSKFLVITSFLSFLVFYLPIISFYLELVENIRRVIFFGGSDPVFHFLIFCLFQIIHKGGKK